MAYSGGTQFSSCGLTFSLQTINSLYIYYYCLYLWNYCYYDMSLPPFSLQVLPYTPLALFQILSIPSWYSSHKKLLLSPSSPLGLMAPIAYGLGSQQASSPSIQESYYCLSCYYHPPFSAPPHTTLLHKLFKDCPLKTRSFVYHTEQDCLIWHLVYTSIFMYDR